MLPIYPMLLPTMISRIIFLVRRVPSATLGKNPDDGLYYNVLPIAGIFC